jgi:glycosyltransferase involved in cell wall biosynthesis
MKISFIVPAYNEQEKVGDVLKQLKENFQGHEIVAVDDASTDNTCNIIQKAGIDSLIKHNKNRGPGGAVKTGIAKATGDFIVIVDADGQHPMHEIQKVVEYITENPEIEAVLTQRVNRYSSGITRNIGKFFIAYVVKRLTRENIRDVNCGLRAFHREKILPFLFLLPDGFSYVTTLTVLAYKEDFSLKWIDIVTEERKSGKSQVKIKHGINTFLLVFRLIVVFDPMKFFMPLTGLSFLLGVAAIIYGLIVHGSIGKIYIFLFLFGSLIFVLGMLSEQISHLRREIVNTKPKQ